MVRTLILALVVGGCAAQHPDPQHPESGSGSGSNMVCHEVTDTGSMFSHTECTPIEEKKAEQDDAQRFMKRPRSQPTGGK
jgi:hypothetical protein